MRPGAAFIGAALTAFVAACSDEERGQTGSGGSTSSDASVVGGTQGTGDSGGSSGAGGTSGAAGSGGTGATAGGSSGSSGAAGAQPDAGECTCPLTPPVGGTPCAASCQGETCAYEHCDGEGFLQASCADAWFISTTACGDHPCAAAETCSPGYVCVQQAGGALLLHECRPHFCGEGPITCDCLNESCPGECSRTGVKDFMCNTCPGGLCP